MRKGGRLTALFFALFLLMTVRNAAEHFLFIGTVGVRQTDENDEQDDRAAPDGAIAEEGTAYRTEYRAERKHQDQRAVGEQLFRGYFVTMAEEFCRAG